MLLVIDVIFIDILSMMLPRSGCFFTCDYYTIWLKIA